MPIDVGLTEKLYTEYRPKVFAYIKSQVQNEELAEDLCSDVFVKVFEKADGFDAAKASASTWIFTITRHTLIDYYRTRRVLGEIPEVVTSAQNVEDEVLNADMLDTLADALSELEERQRDLIILRYYDGKTLREISEQLGISYAYAKVLQNKAFSFLRKKLENV